MATKHGKFVPNRGDIVWLDFNPQSGHEQRGRRPALVLSPKEYNKKTNLALLCPITTQIKNYPFEVVINNKHVTGVILADQLKSLDWNVRNAQLICKADKDTVDTALALINTLLHQG